MVDAWNEFISFEKDFQKTNIQKLKTYALTEVKKLSNENFGWITQPYLDKLGTNIFLDSIDRTSWLRFRSLIYSIELAKV
jgi:ribosomal protein S17E